MPIDSIIFAPYIISIDQDKRIYQDHALLIHQNKIQDIVPKIVAQGLSANKIYELDRHVLMPGLINLHGHSAMTLLRGLADDLALMDWLNNHIWPAEGQWVSDEFVYDGTSLAMAEMLRGGTTTINDMYFYHDSVARAAQKMGMRTFVGCSILEFPTNYAQNADDYIAKALFSANQYRNDTLVKFTLAPHAPYTVADETFKKIVQLAEKNDYLIHCHIHETQDEIQSSMETYHQRPLARLNHLGVLSQRLIAAHMVHTTEAERQLLSEKRVSVAHNPASNMKLASGFAAVQPMLDSGVNVGLGTDGAASNNKLDMLADLRLAALIAKGHSGNPTDLKAHQAIEMATINGAKALGLSQQIGSLEVGKQADIIAINLGDFPETQPVFDVVSHVVYAAGREQVSHVWVNGELKLVDRALVSTDLQALQDKARYWQKKVASL